jgi:hypothetical protein
MKWLSFRHTFQKETAVSWTTEVLDPYVAKYQSWRDYQLIHWFRKYKSLQDYWDDWCKLHPEVCPIDIPQHQEPPGGWPMPDPPPYALLNGLSTGNAISSLLGSVGYIGPDQEGGPDPNGPLGPVIRDVLVGLRMVRLASSLGDSAEAKEVQAVAARLVRTHAEQLSQAVE